jgi:phage I-like protein
VAPGGRNTAAPRNKVVITSSEAAIAKRLGLSNKEYAAQKLKDMQND